MWKIEVDVESNGFVVFDPEMVRAYFGEHLALGDNLFEIFQAGAAGDAVLEAGVIVPVLAIDDLGYEVIVRMADEPTMLPEDWVISRNEFYGLKVVEDLVVADLESITMWDEGRYGTHVRVPPGIYRVSIVSFASPQLRSCGYEFTLESVAHLPEVSANTGARMRVLPSDLEGQNDAK